MDWHRQYFAYHFEDLDITASSGAGTVGAFETIQVRTDSNVDFEGVEMCHIATSDEMHVRISDDSYGRFMHNTIPLDLRNISGTAISHITPNGFKPFVWPIRYLIAAGNTITLEVADFSGSTNLLRLVFHGAKLRHGLAPWDKKWKLKFPFFLNETVSLDANGTASINLSVGTDADFLIKSLTAVRTGAALITVKSGDTDEQWTNQPLHIDNMFGNSQYPHEMNAPRHIRKGTVINVTLQNLTGSTNVIRLSFGGIKLYS